MINIRLGQPLLLHHQPQVAAPVGVAQRQQVCLRVEMRQRNQVKESESKSEKWKWRQRKAVKSVKTPNLQEAEETTLHQAETKQRAAVTTKRGVAIIPALPRMWGLQVRFKERFDPILIFSKERDFGQSFSWRTKMHHIDGKGVTISFFKGKLQNSWDPSSLRIHLHKRPLQVRAWRWNKCPSGPNITRVPAIERLNREHGDKMKS